ncbi:MAG: hypothetical protein AAF799_18635 [Myxococcota bacterium]
MINEDADTLRIPRKWMRSALAAAAEVEISSEPLRGPDRRLGPTGQALDLLDCIDDSFAWAEKALQGAEALIEALPARAAEVGWSTTQLRTVAALCLEELGSTFDPYAMVPERGHRLVHELFTLGDTLRSVRSRSRSAGKHVLRLALQAPGVVARARRAVELSHADDASSTLAWLQGLPSRAKDSAYAVRLRLSALPARAEALRQRLQDLSVESSIDLPARRRAGAKTVEIEVVSED